MKKFLSMFAIAALFVAFAACDDDDEETPDAPSITAPTNVQSVTVGGTLTINFPVSVPGGFQSATAAASSGSATVTPLSAGATSGTVAVAFTAPTTPGTVNVTLTVTDSNNKTNSQNAAVTVSASAVPTIAGIPVSATIVAGETLSVPNVVLTAADGFASSNAFTVSVNDGDPINIPVTGSSPATITVTYPTTIQMIGVNNLVFTLTDADGDVATFTHVLTLSIPNVPKEIVNTNITANTTWTKDKIWELATRVTVLNGATLTIEAGTVIKGQPGTGANATALLVARGGKLMAEGTAEEPIIFTSTNDNIVPGLIRSPNLASNLNGQWGGVIILGNAPISASSSSGGTTTQLTEVQIEGIPTSDPNGLYGGNNKTDNSGTIRYISIRHGGTNIGAGNEINGLTLGGVGSGTIIENVEIVANQDDGIEFFGGTVSVTNALVWNSFDDALDTDQAWNGTVTNFIVVAPNTGSAFELDGPEGTYKDGKHKFINGTVYAGPNIVDLIDFDANTNVDVENVYFFGITNNTAVTEFKAMSDAGNGTVKSLQYTLPADKDPAVVFKDIPTAELTSVSQNANTVGANAAVFGWTWAWQSGALAQIGIQ